MTSSQDVKQYYDEFTAKRMLQYKLYGNFRIERAVELINNYVTPDSRILDLGCGIGIVPEQLAKNLETGNIVACDLSSNNINYALQTVASPKIEFLNLDVVEDFATISQKLQEPVDLVTMVDVIEHLPPGSYEQLWQNIQQVTSEHAKFILTYPSPEYQAYLRRNQPEELQIIDETIEIADLMRLANQYQFQLEYFSYLDLWQTNQYIHCVFSKQLACKPQATASSKLQKMYHLYRGKLLMPFLKRKYLSNPLNNQINP